MSKILIVSLAVFIIGFVLWFFLSDKPNKNLPKAEVKEVNKPNIVDTNTDDIKKVESTSSKNILNQEVKINWKGFGPGKYHDGSFGKIDSNLSLSNEGKLQGFVKVDMTTLNTTPDQLVTHLKSKDFFDVEVYKEAVFTIKENTENSITGTFTIHGITKDITFPIKKSDTSYSAEFRLDMKNFGIEQKFAESEIELMLVVPFN